MANIRCKPVPLIKYLGDYLWKQRVLRISITNKRILVKEIFDKGYTGEKFSNPVSVWFNPKVIGNWRVLSQFIVEILGYKVIFCIKWYVIILKRDDGYTPISNHLSLKPMRPGFIFSTKLLDTSCYEEVRPLDVLQFVTSMFHFEVSCLKKLQRKSWLWEEDIKNVIFAPKSIHLRLHGVSLARIKMVLILLDVHSRRHVYTCTCWCKESSHENFHNLSIIALLYLNQRAYKTTIRLGQSCLRTFFHGKHKAPYTSLG